MKVPKLSTLLKYKRPARSSTEEEFINRYIDSIPGVYSDAYGNRILIHPNSKTIISTHTDTVHRTAGYQQGAYKGPLASLPKNSTSNCLGADDTAGVYAALRMIQVGVKATFIFHRDEEIGGRGSAWLAANHKAWLATYDRCIALDRRGTQDIITHQSFGRCCSNDFALTLGEALDMGHKPSDLGIFTDSANYVGIIPECSNLSVGYYNEHTQYETLNTLYLEKLIERLIKVDWDSLPTEPWVDDSWPQSIVFDYQETCDYCGFPQPVNTELRRVDNSLVCEYCYEEVYL